MTIAQPNCAAMRNLVPGRTPSQPATLLKPLWPDLGTVRVMGSDLETGAVRVMGSDLEAGAAKPKAGGSNVAASATKHQMRRPAPCWPRWRGSSPTMSSAIGPLLALMPIPRTRRISSTACARQAGSAGKSRQSHVSRTGPPTAWLLPHLDVSIGSKRDSRRLQHPSPLNPRLRTLLTRAVPLAHPLVAPRAWLAAKHGHGLQVAGRNYLVPIGGTIR